jgi:serine/threonine protein phosphatase 1
MSQRIIAIGDVHGCAVALRALVTAIQPATDDTLIVLGDCVDRGPDSRDVIEHLLAMRALCRLVPILGNHEEMMLNYLARRPQPDDWLQCGGAETLASYRARPNPQLVPAEHVDFLSSWGNYWEDESYFFAHGGYDPDVPLDKQRWDIWRWQSLRDYVPEPHCCGKTAVVGHTSQKDGEIFDIGYLKCIDTYCYGGGWLTALDITTGRVWQAARNGSLRDERQDQSRMSGT